MNPDTVKLALDAIESGDPAKMAEALKALLAGEASGEVSGGEDSGASLEGTTPAADAPVEASAAISALQRITGTSGPGEAIAALVQMRATVDRLSAESAALELSQRRELVGELVRLGVEFPSTAWEGDPAARNPVARLRSEPISDLRARIVTLRSLRTETAPRHTPPVSGASPALTPEEEAHAATMTDAQRKRFIALRASRRAS